MELYKKLIVPIKHSERVISFGIASTQEERINAYRLRFDVYSQRGYIDTHQYPNKMETDEFDAPNKSILFIATLEDKIIGCIRLITTIPLPTEQYFSFTPPEKIEAIPAQKRGELGRFVIIPPDRNNRDFLPRGIVMLFMFDTLAHYGLQHNIEGGYAFIKKSLEKKMQRVGIPFENITPYHEQYPKNGVLKKYFTQQENPVIPVYFLTKACADFTAKKIGNRIFFKKAGEHSVRLRSPFLISFLQRIKIL